MQLHPDGGVRQLNVTVQQVQVRAVGGVVIGAQQAQLTQGVAEPPHDNAAHEQVGPSVCAVTADASNSAPPAAPRSRS